MNLLRYFIAALGILALASAHAQSDVRALTKKISDSKLTSGFKSGAQTIEITADGTLTWNSGATLTNASDFRASAGLVIGTNVQAWNAKLDTLATGFGAIYTEPGILQWTGTTYQVLTSAVPVTNGGTGLSTYTLGDLLYASGTTTLAKLSGNTTTTKKFLTQTGDGGASAAPAWDTISAGDVPTLNQNTTGNAATATALETARTINGTAFDGTANITITAAAETLTGSALPALDGSALTNLNASALASGTVGTARLGTGTADSTTYLRGDNTWQTISSGLTIGTTAISGGASQGVLYHKADNTVGELSGLTLSSGTLTAATAAAGTITASSPGLTVTQTWNEGSTAFTAATIDITNTASVSSAVAPSYFLKVVLGGSTIGGLEYNFGSLAFNGKLFLGNRYNQIATQNGSSWNMIANDAYIATAYDRGFQFSNSTGFHWSATSSYNTSAEVSMYRLTTRWPIIRADTSACALAVAGTYTSSTNFEAGVIDTQTTAGHVRIGSEVGSGGGSAMIVDHIYGGTVKETLGANTNDDAQPRKLPSYTVSGLPSAATCGAGSMAMVTDATSTTAYTTVAGGGANTVLVISDGTNWIIH